MKFRNGKISVDNHMSNNSSALDIVITDNTTRSIWNFRRSLVKYLIKKGHRVTIFAPLGENVEELQLLGCTIVDLEMSPNTINFIENYKSYRKFKSFFRNKKPDVILGYTIKNNIFGALAARSSNISFIPNITGLGTMFLSSKLSRISAQILYMYAFKKSEIVFFQNIDDRDLFVDLKIVKPGQSVLVPGSGVDLRHFDTAPYPKKNAATRFLLIARLLRDKGVMEYVEAARMLRREGSDARFQLLGAAGEKNRSAIDRETVAKWEAEGVIEYLGVTSDVRPYIAAANCVVLPSYREGAPRTLIEAASMGRPIIATNVPGCRSVIDANVSGYLCASRSSDSLASAIQKFSELPKELQERMGRAGRAKMIREFDERLVLKSYDEAIQKLTELPSMVC